MDPMQIPRPAADAGFRLVNQRLDALEAALGQRSAMISQITTTTADQTVSPWLPTTAYADHAVVTLPCPVWAQSVVIIASGHVLPKLNTLAGSPYVYARLRVSGTLMSGDTPTQLSQPFFSWLAAADMPAALSWAFLLSDIDTDVPVTVATQALTSTSGAESGGSVAVSGVALWIR